MGFILPAVRIQDNLQINANSYVVRVKEIEAGRGDLRPNMLLVMDPRGDKINLSGEETVEPTFGLPAMWVDSTLREEADRKSTRLNSSHGYISYAVFCLKKKKKKQDK